MSNANKGKFIKFRITEILKKDFIKQLDDDGISQSKFFTACVMNYLGMETVPEYINSNSSKKLYKEKNK